MLTRRTELHVRWAILIAILVNAMSMLTPIINEGDSIVYASLAQHMVIHSDWANLMLAGSDWLDKPHFPFWMTALSFKAFGVSAFSYIFPGFLFHLVGGYYTFRIARLQFGRDSALLALLVYVSVFHLMYTSSAVKAEAYLTGSITAACYYWLRYDASDRSKHLILGALFTAISVMTKGIFTLITIASGFLGMWLFQRQWRKIFSLKWLTAIALSMLITFPEVLSLYSQFDSHPEKVVFGKTHVSGVRFFLWDSQFGRFFNSGPIKNEDGTPFYFLHVFLWAFLPWVAVFMAATFSYSRKFSSIGFKNQANMIFLAFAFFVTFALFSATSFQLDYYTVILFPFAAVLCGHYLSEVCSPHACTNRFLVIGQNGISILLIALAIGFGVYVENKILIAIVVGCAALMILYTLSVQGQANYHSIIFLPLLAVCVFYGTIERITFLAVEKYSIPYNLKQLIPSNGQIPIYFYKVDYIVPLEFELYSQTTARGVFAANELPVGKGSYFLVVRSKDFSEVSQQLGSVETIGAGHWVDHKTGVLPRMLKLAKGDEPVDQFLVLKVDEGISISKLIIANTL